MSKLFSIKDYASVPVDFGPYFIPRFLKNTTFRISRYEWWWKKEAMALLIIYYFYSETLKNLWVHERNKSISSFENSSAEFVDKIFSEFTKKF